MLNDHGRPGKRVVKNMKIFFFLLVKLMRNTGYVFRVITAIQIKTIYRLFCVTAKALVVVSFRQTMRVSKGVIQHVTCIDGLKIINAGTFSQSYARVADESGRYLEIASQS